MLNTIISDKFFWAAFLAGLFFWAGYDVLVPLTDSALSRFTLKQIVLSVLAYPLLEEAAFRGWLQGKLLTVDRFKKKWMMISAANVITSLAFVAIHLFYHNWYWAVAVFVPSLVFGFFRERYNSIIPGCVLHAWYNSGFYFLLI